LAAGGGRPASGLLPRDAVDDAADFGKELAAEEGATP